MENSCVFCDRSKFEERLAGENKDFYVIATLGQITDGGYLLLVPKRHAPCVGALNAGEIAKTTKLLNQAASAVIDEYIQMPLVFEHGIVGQTIQHAHIHIMPAGEVFGPASLTKRVLGEFPESVADSFSTLEAFKRVYPARGERYLLWRDGLRYTALWNPPAPAQYLRTVTAELLGRPERGNWRNMDPELDKKLWSETVTRMKPYFK